MQRRLQLAPCIGICLLSVLTGCADGPFGRFASLNPIYTKEWAADEAYGPTPYQQHRSLLERAETAGSQPAHVQQQWSQEMLGILQHNDNIVMRTAAIGVLSQLPTPAARHGLRNAIADENPQVRIAACDAWRSIRDTEAMDHLARTLGSDTNDDVRIAAARALGDFQHPSAVQALGLALDDSDPALQFRAVQSLKTAAGRDFGDNVPAWRDFVAGRIPDVSERTSWRDNFTDLF